MTPLTPQQIAQIRRALGVYSARFTDQQLNDYAADAWAADPNTWFQGTMAEAFYTLALAAVELTDFKQGETTESMSKIYDRLWALYGYWNDLAGNNALPRLKMGQVRLHHMDIPPECY